MVANKMGCHSHHDFALQMQRKRVSSDQLSQHEQPQPQSTPQSQQVVGEEISTVSSSADRRSTEKSGLLGYNVIRNLVSVM